jgi:methionyl-tRNA formyltransferase
MNDQADAGEVILQASYPLDTDETLESARDKADRLSAQVIQEWLSCGIAP